MACVEALARPVSSAHAADTIDNAMRASDEIKIWRRKVDNGALSI
jgi:hypothetical protein